MKRQTNFDFVSVVLAAFIALNTIMVMHNIVTENHSMAIVNFLSGILLIIGLENRRNRKNDKR
tara:strand:+ start:548 stop:736 length:189 start_codon:yes stop_codon:yes gene_type:complete